MKPAKIPRHLQKKHKEYLNKPTGFLKSKFKELKTGQKLIEKTAIGSNDEKAVFTSYQASLMVAKSAKPHTIAENLILSAAEAMVTTMTGEKAAKDLNLISVSNDSVKNKIIDWSENIKSHLIERVKISPYFALQVDESLDVSNNENLLAFVHYEFGGKVCEDFLFSKSIPSHTTSAALFTCLDGFIQE